jgi:hypothetical protein
MKTAMQILITELEKIKDYHPTFLLAISTANDLLEKEKEQICNAYTDGLEGPYVGAEQYYNETYNQNEWKVK